MAGNDDSDEKMACSTCGTEVPLAKEMSLCPSCGSDLEAQQEQEREQSE